MKKTALLTTLAVLLLALSGTPLRAQDTIVGGTNLRVGWPNTLGTMGGHPAGNAIGHHNSVASDAALAVGAHDTIDHQISGCSVALGSSNRVTGASSFCAGDNIKLAGQYSFGAGRFLRVSGQTGCMVLGTGIYGPGQSPNLYLENRCSNSLAVGFNSTVPTLFVSESPNNYGLGVTDRTGCVAIGNVTPTAKLHIRSDENEDAVMILEPRDGKRSSTSIVLHDGLHEVSVRTDGSMMVNSIGDLNLEGANVSLQQTRLDLGESGHRKLTLSMAGTPALLCNAYRHNGTYRRHTSGSSFAVEFAQDTLRVRSAANQQPRGTEITNWRDAIKVTTDGHVTLNGKVGLNTDNTTRDYALAVDGGVVTTKVHIQSVSDWPDHVFGGDYTLAPLDELREYVAENRHLPGVPSEAEVRQGGYDVGAMQAALLEKIEELTLYILGQQREMDTLKKELEELRATVSFAYDACGNRVGRTLELKRDDEGKRDGGGDPQPAALARHPSATGDRIGEARYTIRPNPTRGKVTLSMDDGAPAKGATATILTVAGAVVEERAVSGAGVEFDLGEKPAGVYLLRLTAGDETHTWRIVKGE